MRKKMAFVLAVVMLSHVMYVYADPGSEPERTAVDINEGKVREDGGEAVETSANATMSGNTVSEDESKEDSKNETEMTTARDEENAKKEEPAETTAGNAEEALTEKEAESEIKEQSVQDDIIYNVSFPADTHAFLDPGNLSGQGQIFSEQYVVENYGNTDIVISLKDIDIRYRSEEEIYELTEEEVVDTPSHMKKMNINMVWRNEDGTIEKTLHVMEGKTDECVLVLKAAQYDRNGKFVSMSEGGRGTFCFTGTLNANPNIVWEKEELIIGFDYEIASVDQGEYSEALNAETAASEHETENELNESDSPDNNMETVGE